MKKKSKRGRITRKLSTLDDFLAQQGKQETFEVMAIEEVLAWQRTLRIRFGD
jgi:hypothetical protein